MKVICDAPGQTCNRLWSYVATISECIVKKKRMMILFYDYTIEDFPNLKNCPFIYFPLYNKRWLEKGNNWNRFKGLTWKATHSTYLDRLYSLFGFLKGWHTRNQTEYIYSAKSELKKIYTPREAIVNVARSLLSKMKEKHNRIIGVHIRRGDYIEWNDGRFYYTWEQYKNFMECLKNLYSNEKIAFFISSNEKISKQNFEGCDCYFFENIESPVITDLYMLSICDQIIGPPSTFSRWASFYGEVPLCFLYEENQQITENEFSVIIDYFHFQDGTKISDW